MRAIAASTIAIEVLLEAIEREPRKPPQHPPFPVLK